MTVEAGSPEMTSDSSLPSLPPDHPPDPPRPGERLIVPHHLTAKQLAQSCSIRDLDLSAPVLGDRTGRTLTCAERWRLTRNLYVISIGFMLIFSAFNSMQNLVSSLLDRDSLGLISLSCVYALAIISCFLSPWMLKVCPPKYIIVSSYVSVTLFVASLLYATPYTLIPTSVLWGLCCGPLWTVATLYVTTCAINYASSVQGSIPGTISQFVGIMMMFQQMSQVIGNVLSSLVLEREAGVPDIQLGRNCGALYDREFRANVSVNVTGVNVTGVPAEALYQLGGIYISLSVSATLLTVVLLKPFVKCSREVDFGSVLSFVEVLSDQLSPAELLTSTLHLMRERRMYLTTPLSFMVGMQMSYLFADFTQAFVGCGLGLDYIGFTMIAFGVSNTLACYMGGRLFLVLGRVPLFSLAFTLNLSLYVTMLLWAPAPGDYFTYFLVPSLWGVVDAILQPQTMAFLGYLFPVRQEIAFANYNLFKYLGMASTFAYSGWLSLPVKLYLATGLTLLAMACYYLVEWSVYTGRRRRKKRKQEKSPPDVSA